MHSKEICVSIKLSLEWQVMLLGTVFIRRRTRVTDGSTKERCVGDICSIPGPSLLV